MLHERGRVRSKAEFQRALEKIRSLRTLIKDGLKVLNIQVQEHMIDSRFNSDLGENTIDLVHQIPGEENEVHPGACQRPGEEDGGHSELSFQLRVEGSGQEEHQDQDCPEKPDDSSALKVQDIPGSPDLSSDSGFRYGGEKY